MIKCKTQNYFIQFIPLEYSLQRMKNTSEDVNIRSKFNFDCSWLNKINWTREKNVSQDISNVQNRTKGMPTNWIIWNSLFSLIDIWWYFQLKNLNIGFVKQNRKSINHLTDWKSHSHFHFGIHFCGGCRHKCGQMSDRSPFDVHAYPWIN